MEIYLIVHTYTLTHTHTHMYIQGIQNRMVPFQMLKKIYFSPYTGTTYTVSSGNCPSFSCATSVSLLMLTAGPRGQFPRCRRSRNRLSVCSVLRCPDLRLQLSVSFVHGLDKTHHASFLNRARNSRCTVIADLDTSKRSTQKAFFCCDAILETGPAAPQ